MRPPRSLVGLLLAGAQLASVTPAGGASGAQTRAGTVAPTPAYSATSETTPAEGPGASPVNEAVLVGAGGIASCSSSGDEATATLLDSIPGTVFAAGDNAYDKGTASQFADCFDPTWGRHKARTRPTPGNHDYGTSAGAPYYAYFGAAAGEAGKGFYSYDLGAWHIVVLNSMCPTGSGCSAGSVQERWLRADLAAHPTECTAAIFHHPLFSSDSVEGSVERVKAFWDVLYEHGVEMTINGHARVFERFAPQDPEGRADPGLGIREFNLGTGGRGHANFGTPLPNSEVRDRTSWGVMKFTLRAGAYDWEFLPVPGAPFRDMGTGTCHGRVNTSITSGPSGTVSSTSARFAFASSTPGATFECSLDGAAFASCTSPIDYAGLSQSDHAFSVRAVADGSADPSPAQRSWTVDPSATSVTIFAPDADAKVLKDSPTSNFGNVTPLKSDASPVAESYARFTVSGVKETVRRATLRLYVTNGSPDGPALYPSVSGWSEGEIDWDGRPARTGEALDDLGAINPRTWVEYDVTDAVSGNGDYSFNLAGPSRDGSDFSSREATSNQPQLVLETGLAVADSIPPDTSIDSGPTGEVAGTSASFSFSATEARSVFGCSLDGAAFTSCTSPRSYSGLAAGTHAFDVRAIDPAGNVDLTPARRSWTVAPATTTTVGFGPEADARTVNAYPTTNFGNGTYLESDGSPVIESLLRFSVQGVEGTVRRAVLRLYVTNGSANGPGLYRSDPAWSESEVTWNSRPPISGQLVADLAAVSAGTFVELDVTAIVTGNGDFGFTLSGPASDGTDFRSREATTNPPRLLVSYG